MSSIYGLPSFDGENLFIWAHSNGGQIALTTLAASGADYPTVLWAPVTKEFPYSVLYYLDESEDGGKFIRSELAKLEKKYEAGKFSFTNYLDRIKAPIQLYQGGTDDAIPLEWSRNFVALLRRSRNVSEWEDKNLGVEYFEYPEADHNLMPDWDGVVENNIEFYREAVKN